MQFFARNNGSQITGDFVARIELDQGFRPKTAFRQRFLNDRNDFRIADIDETLNITAIISNDPIVNLKTVHIDSRNTIASLASQSLLELGKANALQSRHRKRLPA